MGSIPKIPTVDFSGNNLKPGSNSWTEACNKVCNALEDYGCFVATLSDEDCSEIHSIFGGLAELFDFPKEIKLLNTHEKPFRGYYAPNSLNEGFGIDDPTDPEATNQFTKLFWPHGNHHFSETANSFAKLTKGIDQTVTRMIFEHYGVENHHCESLIGSTDSVLRLHKYDAAEKEKSHEGLKEHTDLNLTTIIYQNNVNGLEVKTKHGDQWIGFDASPNSFIFMIGDAFQVWSNDRIQACLHRVTMNQNAVRYTAMLFTFHNGILTVPEELIDEEHPLKYKPLNNLEYVASQVSQKCRVSVKKFCGL